MWILFFLSSFFLVSFLFDVFGVIQNDQIILSPYHTSLPETLISASLNFPSLLFITLLCGCVWSGVFPLALSSSPSFLGEGAYAFGARRGYSPARRGDRGEILLSRRSPDSIPGCTWVTKHSSNFFLLH